MLKDISIKRKGTFENLLDLMYPVGTLYFSFDNNSPASKFGGMWVQLTETFLYCANSSNVSGGTNQQKLTINQMPNHGHNDVYALGQGGHVYLSSYYLQSATASTGYYSNIIGSNPGWGYYKPKNARQDYDKLIVSSVGGSIFQQYARLHNLLLLKTHWLNSLVAM